MHFSWFLHCILTVLRRNSLESILPEGSAWQYMFFPDAPILFWDQHGVGKNALGSSHYGDTLHYLWTLRTWFRFWVTWSLDRSSCDWYVALVNDRVMKGENILYQWRKAKKKTEPGDTAEKQQRRGRTYHLGLAQTRMSPRAPCFKLVSSDSRKFQLPRGAGKYVARTNFTNKSKTAVLEVLVQNNGRGNLCDIGHSDCSYGLRDCWFVLLTRQIGHWI